MVNCAEWETSMLTTFTYIPYLVEAHMGIYYEVASINLWSEGPHILCKLHFMLLAYHQQGCHNVNKGQNALILNQHIAYRCIIGTYMYQKANWNIYLTCYYHIWTRNKMLATLHIYPKYAISFTDIYWGCMCIYEATSTNCMTRRTEDILHKLNFMLLAYLWLLITNIGHTTLILYEHTSGTYMCQNTSNCNIYFTGYCHICARNRYACHIAYICHTWYIFQEMYVYICATYEFTASNMWPRNTYIYLYMASVFVQSLDDILILMALLLNNHQSTTPSDTFLCVDFSFCCLAINLINFSLEQNISILYLI